MWKLQACAVEVAVLSAKAAIQSKALWRLIEGEREAVNEREDL